MMTIALLAFVGFVAWFGFGLLICRPILRPLYDAIVLSVKGTSYSSYCRDCDNKIAKGQLSETKAKRAQRWLAFNYSLIALIWPLSFLYGIALAAVNWTPQLRDQRREEENKRLATELEKAQKTIREFNSR
jgi:hypothetical protein